MKEPLLKMEQLVRDSDASMTNYQGFQPEPTEAQRIKDRIKVATAAAVEKHWREQAEAEKERILRTTGILL